MDHRITAFEDRCPGGIGADVSDSPHGRVAAGPELPNQRYRFMSSRAHGTDRVASDEAVGSGYGEAHASMSSR
jgi:hypothetical protein